MGPENWLSQSDLELFRKVTGKSLRNGSFIDNNGQKSQLSKHITKITIYTKTRRGSEKKKDNKKKLRLERVLGTHIHTYIHINILVSEDWWG